jgi:hypothetical protein
MPLNKTDVPNLTASESLSSGSPDKTLYLEIDLEVAVQKGQSAVKPMTAVFSPDPTKLGSSSIDVLLWFHGHKGQLNKTINLKGYSAQQYLQVAEFKLREFILTTGKKQFLLVVPTLGDKSGAGVLARQDQAEAFLQQVLNGVQKHMGAKTATLGNIVLAAHSGGGAIMSKLAGYSGAFDNVKEIWCVDCTYGSGPAFKKWAETHVNNKLFVFSTGEFPTFEHPTSGKAAVKPGPDNRAIGFWGTGNDAKLIYDYAVAKKSATIEVRINTLSTKDLSKPDNERTTGPYTTSNFTYGFATEHNQSVGFYFPKLVDASKTLS